MDAAGARRLSSSFITRPAKSFRASPESPAYLRFRADPSRSCRPPRGQPHQSLRHYTRAREPAQMPHIEKESAGLRALATRFARRSLRQPRRSPVAEEPGAAPQPTAAPRNPRMTGWAAIRHKSKKRSARVRRRRPRRCRPAAPAAERLPSPPSLEAELLKDLRSRRTRPSGPATRPTAFCSPE
jgi:hypothetical protein